MPADLWDATSWPSPSPELEVRARVHARTRALRRRQSLPVVAVAGALVLAVAVWPQPSAPTGLATEGGTEEAPSFETEAGEGSELPVPSTKATAPSNRPGHATPSPARPSAPGTEAGATAFPSTPTYSSGHPVLRDRAGDGLIETAPARYEPDPTVDLVHLDITADDKALTVELRVVDLSATPLASFTRGRPTAQDYEVSLRRQHDYFLLRLQRAASGAFTVTASFWSDHRDTGLVDTTDGTHFDGVTGVVDVQGDRVRLTAPYRALNQAVAAHAEAHPGRHPPVGIGTTFVPVGSTTSRYQGTYHDAPDRIESNDPTFVYRLGD